MTRKQPGLQNSTLCWSLYCCGKVELENTPTKTKTYTPISISPTRYAILQYIKKGFTSTQKRSFKMQLKITFIHILIVNKGVCSSRGQSLKVKVSVALFMYCWYIHNLRFYTNKHVYVIPAVSISNYQCVLLMVSYCNWLELALLFYPQSADAIFWLWDVKAGGYRMFLRYFLLHNMFFNYVSCACLAFCSVHFQSCFTSHFTQTGTLRLGQSHPCNCCTSFFM